MGGAMSEYRKKAEECVRAAEKMRDPAERIEMLGIARGYMSLDHHADRCQVNSGNKTAPSNTDTRANGLR
jgi:hypothetical protein